ncbi:MAG TPA: murein hydrolase regulator LrgA [Lachnospiraceae bacterium]|nr:murein hydrolase regulator LrgA [Lachnospiraceae bacterium]
MRLLKQFSIILAVAFLGELLNVCLPLPVPASVWGLALMLIFLCTSIIRLEQIKETADFLVEIMPVMFIPAGVGLLTAWDVLRPVWIPVSVITAGITVLVMAVTGRMTQRMIRKGKRKDG